MPFCCGETSWNLFGYSSTLGLMRASWTLPWYLYSSLSIPMYTRALDGHSIGRVTHSTVPASVGQSQWVNTVSTNWISSCSCVLGFSWLQRHNPLIDWKDPDCSVQSGAGLNVGRVKRIYPEPFLSLSRSPKLKFTLKVSTSTKAKT